MIRPDCVSLGRPPQRTAESTFAGASVARGATHSGRPFHRFVTNRCEKCGLTRLAIELLFHVTLESVVEIIRLASEGFLPFGEFR